MSDRFVILHHRLNDSEHWDLMLEYGDSLLTWQLPGDPTGPDSLPMTARQIENHRLEYLTYEGPVSRNRGTVQRVESGVVFIAERSGLEYRFRLQGSRLIGDFLLKYEPDAHWTLNRT